MASAKAIVTGGQGTGGQAMEGQGKLGSRNTYTLSSIGRPTLGVLFLALPQSVPNHYPTKCIGACAVDNPIYQR